ncbi:hypothetical protein FBEOM_5921 [Fusarium beomiforme]|uniref:Uncharacterized protein n=1 Tax=Fusarium beomiforme TaxID=44412 RepID=A0A9P5AKF7_9HYPO|nr:hypothetical protein FBEOM_5921 [Fusarium beomiforme]
MDHNTPVVEESILMKLASGRPHAATPQGNEETRARIHSYEQRPSRDTITHRAEQHSNAVDLLAAEVSDLRRELQGTQQITSRLRAEQHESADLIRKNNTRIRELQDEKQNLMKENSDLRAKLSYATDNLVSELQKKIDAARSEVTSIQSLKQTIAGQTKSIYHLKKEKAAAVNQLNQLRSKTQNENTSNAPKKKKDKSKNKASPSDTVAAPTSQAPDASAGPTQRHSRFSTADLPQISLPEYERVDRIMRRLVRDDTHVMAEMRSQFHDAIWKGGEMAHNVEDFIFHGEMFTLFSFHEVCIKGSRASTKLDMVPERCLEPGEEPDLLVKLVTVDSIRMLQLYNPAISGTAVA